MNHDTETDEERDQRQLHEKIISIFGDILESRKQTKPHLFTGSSRRRPLIL